MRGASNPVKPPVARGGEARRVLAVMLGCVAIAGAVMGRAAWVQVLSNPRLERMARKQFQSRVIVRPRRGSIVDRTGEPLAINIETHSLAVNPSKVRDRRTLARALARATDLPPARLLDRLSGKGQFAWIKRHLSQRELEKFHQWGVLESGSEGGELATGLFLVKESQRVYPHGELAAHLIGDVNVDSEGMEGVELWQNDRMRGKVVSIGAIKDAYGRPTFMDAVAAKDVQDGDQVQLTIDASLQFAVEQELHDSIVKHGARGGSVIVMNAENGEVLAMANQPSFNPNERAAPPDRRRNRVLTDGYEPGSTMKAVLVATALSNGMKLTDMVDAHDGELVIQGRRISEAESHEKWSRLSLRDLVKFSSNVASAQLALRVGADKYLASLKDFGFGTKTATGFPGEISGRLPARKDWQPLTLANIGFGQGVLVTPIQMVRAYASFLNGGWLVQPTLMRGDSTAPLEAPRRVMTAKVAADVVHALEAVTEDKGTGIKANVPGYRVAGKTGTAQKVTAGTRGYARGKYVSSFIGFALEVDPKLVIFTSIDEPQGVYYAAETAVPLFREVLNAVAGRFSLPTREGYGKLAPRKLAGYSPMKLPFAAGSAEEAIATRQAAVAQADADDLGASEQALAEPLQITGTSGDGRYSWRMPPLRGLTPREALHALQGHRFNVEIKGNGVIRAQVPEPGHAIADGETIRLGLTEM